MTSNSYRLWPNGRTKLGKTHGSHVRRQLQGTGRSGEFCVVVDGGFSQRHMTWRVLSGTLWHLPAASLKGMGTAEAAALKGTARTEPETDDHQTCVIILKRNERERLQYSPCGEAKLDVDRSQLPTKPTDSSRASWPTRNLN